MTCSSLERLAQGSLGCFTDVESDASLVGKCLTSSKAALKMDRPAGRDGQSLETAISTKAIMRMKGSTDRVPTDGRTEKYTQVSGLTNKLQAKACESMQTGRHTRASSSKAREKETVFALCPTAIRKKENG